MDGKYYVVQNLTTNDHVVVPARRDMAGQDLVVPAFGWTEVDEEDAPKWERDRNLEKAIADGYVVAGWLEKRPPRLPSRPNMRGINDPRYFNMVKEMVFGRDDIARDLITAEPRYIDRVGQPLNKEWLVSMGRPLLEIARDWLIAWGRPEYQWRVELINQRLEYIRQL